MQRTSFGGKSSLLLKMVAGSFFLTSCATISALTLQEVRGQENYTLTLDYIDCRESQIQNVSLPIIGQLYDAGLKAFKSYIQNKADRFKKSYAVSATLDNLSPGRCLKVKRIDRANNETHLELILAINGRGVNSAEIVPVYLNISKFAASAAPEDGELKSRITVSMGISFVNENTRFGTDAITSLNIPIASTVYKIGKNKTDPNNAFSSQTSKLFPALYDQPVNIAITISEVGNGSQVFEEALSSFDANAAYLKSLLGGEL